MKKGFELESFAVDTAFTGIDGYYLACSEDDDLIVLDVLLPELTIGAVLFKW